QAELHVAALEVAGTVVLDAMAQHQVLRARGRADRIGLHEAQSVEGAFERGGREETAGDGKTSQLVESDPHGRLMPDFARPAAKTRPRAISARASRRFLPSGARR